MSEPQAPRPGSHLRLRETEPRSRRVVISGATGFVGAALVELLSEKGCAVQGLGRGAPPPGSGDIQWDPARGLLDPSALEGVDAVVHLAGENVGGGRWSGARKAAILKSREAGTRLLAETLARLADPPRVLVSVSAIGYYGARGDELLREDSAPGSGFLTDVCRRWERAADPARQAGIRVVHPRIGVVLGQGGPLEKMLSSYKLGMGAIFGNGRQWMSWIALEDLVQALHFLMVTEGVSGAVNLVAPHPVTNEEFTRTLGKVLGRPGAVRVPELALKLLLGEMGQMLLLDSTRAAPARLQEMGFRFRHPELEGALRSVLNR